MLWIVVKTILSFVLFVTQWNTHSRARNLIVYAFYIYLEWSLLFHDLVSDAGPSFLIRGAFLSPGLFGLASPP